MVVLVVFLCLVAFSTTSTYSIEHREQRATAGTMVSSSVDQEARALHSHHDLSSAVEMKADHEVDENKENLVSIMYGKEERANNGVSATNATYTVIENGMPINADGLEIPPFSVNLFVKHHFDDIDERELALTTAKVLSETFRLYDTKNKAFQFLFLNVSTTREEYRRILRTSQKHTFSANFSGVAYYTGDAAPSVAEIEQWVKEGICGDNYQISLARATDRALASVKKIEFEPSNLARVTVSDGFRSSVVAKAESGENLSVASEALHAEEKRYGQGLSHVALSSFAVVVFVSVAVMISKRPMATLDRRIDTTEASTEWQMKENVLFVDGTFFVEDPTDIDFSDNARDSCSPGVRSIKSVTLPQTNRVILASASLPIGETDLDENGLIQCVKVLSVA